MALNPTQVKKIYWFIQVKSPGPFRVGLNFMVGLTQASVTVMDLVSGPVHSAFMVLCHLQCIVGSPNVRRLPNTLGATYSLLHIQRKREYANERGQTDRHISGKLFQNSKEEVKPFLLAILKSCSIHQPMPLMREWVQTDQKIQWFYIPLLDSKVK